MIISEYSKGRRIQFIIDEEEKTVEAWLSTSRDDAIAMFDSMVLKMIWANSGGPICPNEYLYHKKKYLLPNSMYVGKAKCHPNDVFDVEFGKRLALFRAQAKYHNAVDRKLSAIWDFIDDLKNNTENMVNKHYRKYLDICSDLYVIEKSVGA